MVTARPTAPTASLRLIYCAAASLGVLFVKGNTVLATASPETRSVYPADVPTIAYVALAVPALALIAWQLAPRRSWPWLLLAGAIGAAPNAVLRAEPDLYGDWMRQPLVLLTTIGSAATLVGLLGAASWLWRSGRPGAGGALTGTALMIQLVGPIISLTVGFHDPQVVRWLDVVLPGVALLGSLAAVVLAGPVLDKETEPQQRPGWRVTIVGGLAAAAPLVYYVWTPDITSDRTFEDVTDSLADYYLYIGLTFFAIGIVLGLLTSRPILGTAAATGLLLGALGMMVVPSVEVLVDYVALTVVCAVGSVIVGFVLALSRWRTQVSIAGLGIVTVGVVVLAVLFNSNKSYDSYDSFSRGLTPALVVVGIIATISALASVGSTVAEDSSAPAAMAGLATAFSLGTIAIIARFWVDHPEDKAPIAGVLPPAAVALLVAVALIGILAAVARARPRSA